MRKLVFSLLLAVGGAMGLAASTPAQASHDDRIYIGLGDVVFSYGRPYWRHNHEPLYVVYEYGRPRYYRIVNRYYGPAYAYPPPPAWGYRRDRDWRWDRDRRWDRDWRWDRDRRHYPRQRDRRWD